nr:sigma factor [uncultured Blautia sp.]
MTKDAFIREIRNAEIMLYHISKSILKNDSDCGDAVQETLLKAYEKLPMLKEEKFFRTWITRILINECKGILRKQKKVVPYEDYMDNERLSEENRYHHLYMAIMELPEDLRILVKNK